MCRPRCRRCTCPLDLIWDAETARYEWSCNNLRAGGRPALTDEQYGSMWAGLAEDERKRLADEVAEKV